MIVFVPDLVWIIGAFQIRAIQKCRNCTQFSISSDCLNLQFQCGNFNSILNWTLTSKFKLFDLKSGSRKQRCRSRGSGCQVRAADTTSESEIIGMQDPSPAVSDRNSTAAGADKAHLGDWRVISLAGGYGDESSCKELFQPQVVVQDHLEQGTLTGRQLGSNRVFNTTHLTQPHCHYKWESTAPFLNCWVSTSCLRVLLTLRFSSQKKKIEEVLTPVLWPCPPVQFWEQWKERVRDRRKKMPLRLDVFVRVRCLTLIGPSLMIWPSLAMLSYSWMAALK